MPLTIPASLKEEIQTAFPNLEITDETAPRGQNSFCGNLIAADQAGGKCLIKVIRLTNKEIDPNHDKHLDEVEALKNIKSQYTIPLIESKKINNHAVLVFPFLEGKNLKEYAMENSFTEDEIKNIGIALLRGVSDLSRAGIVHQDIKPENIFITNSGEVKILDFGSARFKKKSYSGSTKTNRSHSAPEQILASKPSNLEGLRLTCDERCDVYSVGSILYQLVTGNAPFNSNEEKINKNIIPPIERSDISDGMKRIIVRLLNHRPSNRPDASTAASYIQSGDIQPVQIKRGGFFYNASNTLSRFRESRIINGENTFNGLIIEASKIPPSEKTYTQNGPDIIIVDPQTYLFQTPSLVNKKLRGVPYCNFAKKEDVIAFENLINLTEAQRLDFIDEVFDYELYMGTDYPITPFFCIKEFNDASWTLDVEITSTAIERYKQRKIQLPLLKGVAVASNVLVSDTTRGRLIDYLTTTDWRSDIEGYFLLLEGSVDDYPNEAWLKAAKDLIIKLLAAGKSVIWSHASLASLTYAYAGFGIGMGESQSCRSFNLTERSNTFGSYSAHLYVPKIFARIKWPTGHMSLKTHAFSRFDDFICMDSCCNGIDFSNPSTRNKKDLEVHMLRQFSVQFKRYSGTNGAQNAKNDLELAKSIYSELRSTPSSYLTITANREVKPPTGAFLDNWLSALH